MPVPTIALVVGVGLVIEAVNEAWREEWHIDAPLGLPAEEAFPDPVWRPLFRLIREVMRDGVSRFVDLGGMPIWIMPDRSQAGSPAALVVAHPEPARDGTGRSHPDRQPEWAAPH